LALEDSFDLDGSPHSRSPGCFYAAPGEFSGDGMEREVGGAQAGFLARPDPSASRIQLSTPLSPLYVSMVAAYHR